MVGDYGGFKAAGRYRVVAKDSDSVVVADWHPFFGEERLQHIHFEGKGKYYWISVGKVREYFRRTE